MTNFERALIKIWCLPPIDDRRIPIQPVTIGRNDKMIWNRILKGYTRALTIPVAKRSRRMSWYLYGAVRAEAGYTINQTYSDFITIIRSWSKNKAPKLRESTNGIYY